ncbi:unnamed protein product [Brachionus calyciflorus]|uniref:E3 ubiquitin-protein ligase RNF170 n=1 Tax=Brachionus calyciflorus TaxID=104777 RepID=A0A813ZKT8_9BILA|nr:unnamed protein product [Brachionus calyciflorus]
MIRNSLLTVGQLDPRLHQDSINDVNQTRERLMNNRRNREETQEGQNTAINCPICLANSNFPIETNCGHKFCADCIVQYWSHSSTTAYRMNCPMCRQQVNYLLRLYTREEQERNRDLNGETFAQIANYNRRFGGEPRDLLDYIYDIPILFRHLLNELFSFDGLSIWYRVRIMFFIMVAFCYFLSPLDIIPEALFGIFGLIDDLFVVFIIVIYVCTIYRQLITNRG